MEPLLYILQINNKNECFTGGYDTEDKSSGQQLKFHYGLSTQSALTTRKRANVFCSQSYTIMKV